MIQMRQVSRAKKKKKEVAKHEMFNQSNMSVYSTNAQVGVALLYGYFSSLS